MATFKDLNWTKPEHTEQAMWDDLMNCEIPDRRTESWKYAPLKSRLPAELIAVKTPARKSLLPSLDKEKKSPSSTAPPLKVRDTFVTHLTFISLLAKVMSEKSYSLTLSKNEKHELELRTLLSKASEGASIGIDLEINVESGAEVKMIDDLTSEAGPSYLFRRIHLNVGKNAHVKLLTTSRGEKGLNFLDRITPMLKEMPALSIFSVNSMANFRAMISMSNFSPKMRRPTLMVSMLWRVRLFVITLQKLNT